LGTALGVLSALGTTTSARAGQQADAVGVAQQYLSAWQAGDTARMYGLLADEVKAAVAPQEFARAFNVRLPFSDDTWVIRPIRFDHVRARPDSTGAVDYRAVFTAESLLGPSATAIFCRERRDSLSLPDLRRARRQALYLLYDQGRPDSSYLSLGYAVGVWAALSLTDMLAFLPSPSGPPEQAYGDFLPGGGLRPERELVIETGSMTMGPFQISAESRSFRLAALEVSKDGHIALPLAGRQQPSSRLPELREQDFSQLIWFMGLDWP